MKDMSSMPTGPSHVYDGDGLTAYIVINLHLIYFVYTIKNTRGKTHNWIGIEQHERQQLLQKNGM